MSEALIYFSPLFAAAGKSGLAHALKINFAERNAFGCETITPFIT